MDIQQLLSHVAERTEEPKSFFFDAKIQSQILGRFNKSDVIWPLKQDLSRSEENRYVIDTNLCALMGKPINSDKTFWKNNKTQNLIPWAFVGVTGAGKTHKLMSIARHGYTLFFTAADRPEDKDHTLLGLYNAINEGPVNNYSAIYLWIAAKLLCLLYLLDRYEGLSPEAFLYDQLNGRSKYYSECYLSLLECGIKGTADLCKRLVHSIQIHKSNKFKRVGIALDEASILEVKYVGK
jgi:hypothetical protein